MEITTIKEIMSVSTTGSVLEGLKRMFASKIKSELGVDIVSQFTPKAFTSDELSFDEFAHLAEAIVFTETASKNKLDAEGTVKDLFEYLKSARDEVRKKCLDLYNSFSMQVFADVMIIVNALGHESQIVRVDPNGVQEQAEELDGEES